VDSDELKQFLLEVVPAERALQFLKKPFGNALGMEHVELHNFTLELLKTEVVQ
jgi:hypothetical protein